MRKTLVVSFPVVFFLTACSMQVPKNPTEFRSHVVKSNDSREVHKSYKVNRSLAAITKTLQKKDKECFPYKFDRRFHMETRSSTNTTYATNVSHITYTPTIKTTDTKTEYYMQMGITGDVMLTYTPPKGGAYVLIVDLTKVSANTTRVDSYQSYYGEDYLLPVSVKNWIEGKSQGCPALEEDMKRAQ